MGSASATRRIAAPTLVVAGLFSASLAAQPRFREIPRLPFPQSGAWSRVVALCDVDSDGDLDAISGDDYPTSKPGVLFLNDGRGGFTDASATHLPTLPIPLRRSTWDLAVADVDLDGDPDLLVASDRSYLLLNNGRGVFRDATAASLPAYRELRGARRAVFADLDDDGDPDLLSARWVSSESYPVLIVFENDGAGRFTDATARLVTGPRPEGIFGYDLDAGDGDGDGDLDVVLGDLAFAQALFINDGSGVLHNETASRLVPRLRGVQSALGDVDGDGDLDLVLGGSPRAFDSYDELLLNDGTGHFSPAPFGRMPKGPESTHDVQLRDLDGDGDLDLVMANTPDRGINLLGHDAIYLNDGSGRFTDVSSTWLTPSSAITARAAVGDVDGDRDPDLLLARAGAGVQLLFNHTRHLEPAGPATVGQDYRLDLDGEPGSTAVLFLGARAARIALPPFGVWGLDPLTSFAWPVHAVVSPQRRASIVIPLPSQPGLAGLPFRTQAVLVDTNDLLRTRFTPPVVDRVR